MVYLINKNINMKHKTPINMYFMFIFMVRGEYGISTNLYTCIRIYIIF